jgi:hypothetical protein
MTNTAHLYYLYDHIDVDVLTATAILITFDIMIIFFIIISSIMLCSLALLNLGSHTITLSPSIFSLPLFFSHLPFHSFSLPRFAFTPHSQV